MSRSLQVPDLHFGREQLRLVAPPLVAPQARSPIPVPKSGPLVRFPNFAPLVCPP